MTCQNDGLHELVMILSKKNFAIPPTQKSFFSVKPIREISGKKINVPKSVFLDE